MKTVKSQGVTGLYRGWAVTCGGAFVYRGGQLGLFSQIMEMNPYKNDKVRDEPVFPTIRVLTRCLKDAMSSFTNVFLLLPYGARSTSSREAKVQKFRKKRTNETNGRVPRVNIYSKIPHDLLRS